MAYHQAIPQNQHCLLVCIKLMNENSAAEDETIYALEEKLQREVEKNGLGEFDGDEWGGGYCKFFIYGKDADKMFDAVSGVLLAHDSPPGSYALKRYGPTGAPEQAIRL